VGFGLDNFKSHPSQIKSRTDLGAGFLVVLALLINGLAVFSLPLVNIPFGVKIFFFAGGVMVTWGAISTWLLYIRAGIATLTLQSDPVPLGIPVTIKFTTSKPVKAKNWSIEAELYSSRERDRIWSQTFQVTQMENNCLQSEIIFPCDEFKFKSILESVSHTITLQADDLTWIFDIKTRTATQDEAVLGLKNALNIGTNLPYYQPDSTESWQWRWFKFVVGIAICVIGYQVISHYDAEVRIRANTKAGSQMDHSHKITT
jgi:hypothetical protein